MTDKKMTGDGRHKSIGILMLVCLSLLGISSLNQTDGILNKGTRKLLQHEEH